MSISTDPDYVYLGGITDFFSYIREQGRENEIHSLDGA